MNGVQALRRLQSLDLSRNCIATVDLLALLPALQVLKVAENSLTSIDALQLLPELRVVDASYNRITKWPPLAGLSLLEVTNRCRGLEEVGRTGKADRILCMYL